ncbi:MAG: alpha/beta hydrolase, partial [Fulvivirga sp.]|nr:alpha/beta hydrolase [Fulvivirga sp.]
YRLYSTEVKTLDAVKLIEQLGYQEVNLFGVSNGTMGIQGFIRAAENSNIEIRSIYSDSNVPMKDYMRGDLGLLYKQILSQILDECANTPECESRFKNLKKRFYAFLKSTLNDPLIYEGEKTIVFNTYEINSVIHQLLYNHANHKDIPLILEAFMNNELEFIDLLLGRFQNLVETANGTSIINYVYDWKARQPQVIKQYQQIKKTHPEFLWADFWLNFYTRDTTITYNPRDTIPVTSDVPALVVAGTHDPVTAPVYSKMMHDRYSNSYYFELPKLGHGVFVSECGRQLFNSFIEHPQEKPEDECVKELLLNPMSFTTSIYVNKKVSHLIQEILAKRNVFWIIVLLLPLILSLIYVIRSIIRTIRKKKVNALRLVLFLCIIMFLTGFVYYSHETLSQGGLTFLFGLVEAAWWLPWCSAAISMFGIVILYRMLKSLNFNFWNVSAILSTVLLLIAALTFDIYLF